MTAAFIYDVNHVIPQTTRIVDPVSGLMLNVVTVDGLNSIPVYLTSGEAGDKICVYGTQLIIAGGYTVTATHTVTTGKKLIFTGVTVGGEESAEFDVLVDGLIKFKLRNTGSNRSLVSTFPEPLEVVAGKVVLVKVRNLSGKVKNFEATISGREI